jgi:tetratricopeptide (TPR) repeat protein
VRISRSAGRRGRRKEAPRRGGSGSGSGKLQRDCCNLSAGRASILRLALADKPNDERTYSAIAGTWIWMREWEPALGALDQAIALNDKYTYAISQRAVVYQVLGRDAAALIDIDRVLSLDPADNYGRRMRAIILMAQGKHKAAKRDLDYCLENQCINDQSRRALRHAQRGVLYFAGLGQYSIPAPNHATARATASGASTVTDAVASRRTKTS